MKTIEKEISINALKEKVWDVLLQDEPAHVWYAEFCEGAHAVSDWQVGSKAIFTDNDGNGLIAKITEHKPTEFISMEYEGELVNGKEEYDTSVAKEIKGGKEVYRLTGNNGTTHLAISGDMDDAMFEPMSAAWERALKKIKALAEKG